MTQKTVTVQSFRNGIMKFGGNDRDTGKVLSEAQKEEIFGSVDELPNEPLNPNDPDANTGENPVVNDGDDDGFVLPENFDSMTVDELKAFAATNKVDITGLTLKSDIQAKIKSEAKAAE